MSLFHLIHAARLQKYDPPHGPDGKFYSTGGGGAANAHGGITHTYKKGPGFNYTAEHDHQGTIKKVTWFSESGSNQVVYEHGQSKKLTPAKQELMGKLGEAHDAIKQAGGPVQSIATEPKVSPMAHASVDAPMFGSIYTVHHDAHGEPQSIVDYKGNGVWNKGEDTTATHQKLFDTVKEKHLATAVDNKPAPAEAPVTSLGTVGTADAYVVPHKGKNYYVSLQGGQTLKVAEHNPGSPNSKVLFKQGSKAHTEASIEIADKAKEAHYGGVAEPYSPPKASLSDIVGIASGSTHTQASIIQTNTGDHVAVLAAKVEVPDHVKANFADFNAPETAMYSKVYQMDSFVKQHENENLTAPEKLAKNSYQKSSYYMNAQLLAGDETTSATKIKALDKAMSKSYTPVDLALTRGIPADAVTVVGGNPEALIGQTFLHKSFASSSFNENTAKSFGHSTVLKFNLPAGSQALPMTSKIHDEKEIVMPRNSVFRIDSVTKIGGSTVLEVTHMGTLKTDKPKKAKKDDVPDMPERADPPGYNKFMAQPGDIVMLGRVVHDGTQDEPK